MSINSLSHYSLFPGLFIAFTYNKKEQPAFGAALSFWCILLPFLGLSFRHIPNNFSNYNVLTANAPFFYQISGTWSNHEGSLFSWCWIPSFYGFLLCYRGGPQSHNVSKRRGNRETLFCSFVSNFVKNSKLQELKSYENKSGTNKKPDGRLRAPAFALAQPARSLIYNLRVATYMYSLSRKALYPLQQENYCALPTRKRMRCRATAFALAVACLILLVFRGRPLTPLLAGGGEGRLGYVKLSNERSERVKRISALCALAKGERQDATYMLGSEKQSIAIERSRFFSAPFVLRTLAAASLLRSRRNRTFDGPALFYAQLYPGRKMSFAPMGTRRSRSSREGKRTNLFFDLARDSKERASYIDEELRQSAVGIALFFSPFLSASSDPFIRNFFVRTEPLAESNPVPQDPISAIHPPCISAGDVASAMGFGLCRSKMMNGIVALHSPPMRKDSAEKNGTLLCSAGCVGSRRTTELFTLKLKNVGASCYPAILLRSNRSLRPSIKMLRRRFLAFSSLGALMDTGREQANRVVHNGKKDTTPSPLCWTAGANTVVSDQDQEEIRIWILTCRWFLTVGILPGSWWAHHELGRGGWWFRDPVENASFMPRVLATACIHSVILPLHNSWTSLLNIGTLPCCVLGTSSIRSGLLASVHSSATDETRGIFLGRFFLLMTGISMILFSQMKLQASARRTYKKEMVGARSTLVHLRNSARAQPRPQQVPAELTRKPVRAGAHPVSC